MDPKPTIAVKDRESGNQLTYQMDQERIILGRAHESFIVLASKRVSRKHIEIRIEGENFFITDLGSGNGTFLNSQKLSPNEKTLLRTNDKIRVENFDIVFQANGHNGHDFGESTDTDVLEVKMIKKLLRSIDKDNVPVLEIAGGRYAGKKFAFKEKTQEVTIGRDQACEFCVEEEVISRKHARVAKKWDTITLIDLNSTNGIYVNDAKVTEKVLKDGDRILLGTLPLLFRNPTESGWDLLASEPPPKKEKEGADDGSAKKDEVKEAKEKSEKASTEEVPAQSAPGKTTEEHSAAEEEEDESALTQINRILKRFNTTELALAGGGLLVLLGSLWLILKLL
jgi:pSer/pThr/pTyr-binding forkhead associated (FHA) protein